MFHWLLGTRVGGGGNVSLSFPCFTWLHNNQCFTPKSPLIHAYNIYNTCSFSEIQVNTCLVANFNNITCQNMDIEYWRLRGHIVRLIIIDFYLRRLSYLFFINKITVHALVRKPNKENNKISHLNISVYIVFQNFNVMFQSKKENWMAKSCSHFWKQYMLIYVFAIFHRTDIYQRIPCYECVFLHVVQFSCQYHCQLDTAFNDERWFLDMHKQRNRTYSFAQFKSELLSWCFFKQIYTLFRPCYRKWLWKL